jgi:hypothetical protein
MKNSRMHRWIGAVGAVAVVVALPVAWQVLGQGVASAGTVPAAEVVRSEPPVPEYDSEPNYKRREAYCPPGKRVIGGGARLLSAQHVVLTRQEPVHDPSTRDSYVVEASEDQTGFAGAWALNAYAICADPPPGLEIINKTTSAPQGAFHHQETAHCPDGKFVIGAGGRIDGGQGQVDLGTINQGVARSTAAGTTDPDGFDGTWSVTAFVVCVTPNPFSDLHIARDQTAPDSTDTKFMTISCPSDKRVTGGTAFSGSPGVIESVTPDADRRRIEVKARDNSLTPGTGGWDLNVVAFCAS